MTAPVTIGRATLYLGDCRDVLPTLGKGYKRATMTNAGRAAALTCTVEAETVKDDYEDDYDAG